jgi:hypothetical protein
VKLGDFGIAKAALSSHVTQPGKVRGKCAYMAPEQARGRAVDARADVFALGVVLWECLTGSALFDGHSDAEILLQVLQKEVVPPSRLRAEVPAEVDELVLRMLSRDPALRPANGDEAARELARLRHALARSPADLDLGELERSLRSGTAVQLPAAPAGSLELAVEISGAGGTAPTAREEGAPPPPAAGAGATPAAAGPLAREAEPPVDTPVVGSGTAVLSPGIAGGPVPVEPPIARSATTDPSPGVGGGPARGDAPILRTATTAPSPGVGGGPPPRDVPTARPATTEPLPGMAGAPTPGDASIAKSGTSVLVPVVEGGPSPGATETATLAAPMATTAPTVRELELRAGGPGESGRISGGSTTVTGPEADERLAGTATTGLRSPESGPAPAAGTGARAGFRRRWRSVALVVVSLATGTVLGVASLLVFSGGRPGVPAIGSSPQAGDGALAGRADAGSFFPDSTSGSPYGGGPIPVPSTGQEAGERRGGSVLPGDPGTAGAIVLPPAVVGLEDRSGAPMVRAGDAARPAARREVGAAPSPAPGDSLFAVRPAGSEPGRETHDSRGAVRVPAGRGEGRAAAPSASRTARGIGPVPEPPPGFAPVAPVVDREAGAAIAEREARTAVADREARAAIAGPGAVAPPVAVSARTEAAPSGASAVLLVSSRFAGVEVRVDSGTARELPAGKPISVPVEAGRRRVTFLEPDRRCRVTVEPNPGESLALLWEDGAVHRIGGTRKTLLACE